MASQAPENGHFHEEVSVCPLNLGFGRPFESRLRVLVHRGDALPVLEESSPCVFRVAVRPVAIDFGATRGCCSREAMWCMRWPQEV